MRHCLDVINMKPNVIGLHISINLNTELLDETRLLDVFLRLSVLWIKRALILKRLQQ